MYIINLLKPVRKLRLYEKDRNYLLYDSDNVLSLSYLE